jgi:hypothetical protein
MLKASLPSSVGLRCHVLSRVPELMTRQARVIAEGRQTQPSVLYRSYKPLSSQVPEAAAVVCRLDCRTMCACLVPRRVSGLSMACWPSQTCAALLGLVNRSSLMLDAIEEDVVWHPPLLQSMCGAAAESGDGNEALLGAGRGL